MLVLPLESIAQMTNIYKKGRDTHWVSGEKQDQCSKQVNESEVNYIHT